MIEKIIPLICLFIFCEGTATETNKYREARIARKKERAVRHHERKKAIKEKKIHKEFEEFETEYETYEDMIQAHEQLIHDLYKEVNAFKITQQEHDMIVACGGAPTYGEITYKGLQNILDRLDLGPDDVFYDLGCGVGKTVIQVYLNTPVKKAEGVELANGRCVHALKVYKKLHRLGYIKPGRRMVFKLKDMLNVNMSDATVVYTCSTCFDRKLMVRIGEKLSHCKPGLIFLTLKPLPNPEEYGFKLITEYSEPMSWAPSGASVYHYELKISQQ
ncbi:MAG TPA: hypothetical protein VFF04_01940 [Candidatus Babeliales bacterium]|nr:hypothetical protein [Candidatus Babeliales bacterium]